MNPNTKLTAIECKGILVLGWESGVKSKAICKVFDVYIYQQMHGLTVLSVCNNERALQYTRSCTRYTYRLEFQKIT